MNKTLGIFMPARLNSERLPNKHLLPLNSDGLTMWEIACERLSKVEGAEKYVLISEFDTGLVEIAKKHGLNIINRDPETCLADHPLNFVFKDTKKMNTTHIMFLNPCLLTMSVETINKTVKNFLESDKDFATSVIRFRNWVLNPLGQSMIDEIDYTKISTKNIPNRFVLAHCFHIFNKEDFFNDGRMLRPGFGMLEVEPSDILIDIDCKDDYDAAVKYFSK
ncbi:MAG: cytidylyltransferase domain-containing protein [Bacteroidales bacterium]